MERYHLSGCKPICLNIYESVIYNFVIHDYTLKMANLTETNFARKVDSMGRITIPIRLREQVGIEIG